MENNNEIWKDIPNYDGKYQVSNLGNVRSLNYGGKIGYILNLTPTKNEKGYQIVNLQKKKFGVHQLVAICFLNHTPDGGKTQVNHIDHNKLNNNLNNLELCTPKENVYHHQKFIGNDYLVDFENYSIHYNKSDNKHMSYIFYKNNWVYIGQYDDKNYSIEHCKKILGLDDIDSYLKENKYGEYRLYTSKYKGIYFDRQGSKFRLYIKVNGKFKSYGRYESDDEAYIDLCKVNEIPDDGSRAIFLDELTESRKIVTIPQKVNLVKKLDIENNKRGLIKKTPLVSETINEVEVVENIPVKNFSSKYKWVIYNSIKNKWVVQITINNKTYRFGQFETEDEAYNKTLELKNLTDEEKLEYLEDKKKNKQNTETGIEEKNGKFLLNVRVKYIDVYVGTFDTKEEAIQYKIKCLDAISNNELESFLRVVKDRYKVYDDEYPNLYLNKKVNKWIILCEDGVSKYFDSREKAIKYYLKEK